MRVIGLGCVVLCVLAVAGIALAEDFEPGLAAHYYESGVWGHHTI